LVGKGLNVIYLDISKITKACQETKPKFICREMYESSHGSSYLTKIGSTDR